MPRNVPLASATVDPGRPRGFDRCVDQAALGVAVDLGAAGPEIVAAGFGQVTGVLVMTLDAGGLVYRAGTAAVCDVAHAALGQFGQGHTRGHGARGDDGTGAAVVAVAVTVPAAVMIVVIVTTRPRRVGVVGRGIGAALLVVVGDGRADDGERGDAEQEVAGALVAGFGLVRGEAGHGDRGGGDEGDELAGHWGVPFGFVVHVRRWRGPAAP